MKRLVLGATMFAMVIGFNGCAISNSINSSISGNELDTSFEEYKTYGSYKAMAVAMDDDGRYSMGYASDYSSQSQANQKAIGHCTDANNKSEYKVNAECEIYAIDNDIVRSLD